ncbi:MAG: hypothetical protein HRT89_08025 [Lentisphaeria bacterium]|nr:hypothetical protein [Lentisphaeria bacterium]
MEDEEQSGLMVGLATKLHAALYNCMYHWKQTIAWLLLGLVLLIPLTYFRIISFSYPVFVNNQPLKKPVKVTNVNGTQLILGDGRSLNFEDIYFPIQPGDFVELEAQEDGTLYVYTSERRRYCSRAFGNPTVRIPLFKKEYKQNRKSVAAYAWINDEESAENSE